MSLFTILGVADDDLQSVENHIRDFYIENPEEKARINHAMLIDEFYEGRGDAEMERLIDLAWKDNKNNSRRREIMRAGLHKANNVVSRIAREKATVYAEPPRRVVTDPAENLRYQEFQDAVGMNDVMRELDRKLAVHEDALLWYRVRVNPIGEREPVLEVVSPAAFWAVCHPRDRTLLVAVVFDQRMPMAKPSDPSFRVWTHDQTFVMNGKCQIFAGSIESWPLGVMPGVLCSTRQPGSKPTLLAQSPSADLLSAQRAVWLQDLTIAKESISANRQAYISGDTSSAAFGQTADTDTEVLLPEGVSVTVVDRGINQEQFRNNASYTMDAVASNHGLPPSVLHQRDAASGAEIELRRIPIRELRKERIPVMRRIEWRIARVISLVNSSRGETLDQDGAPLIIPGDLPEYAFSMAGWSIDFGEVQQPMTETESLQVFETARRLGLTDNYTEEMRRNPDIRNIDEAKKIVAERIERQTEFVQQQKELMALNGSLGSPANERTAQENGADGRATGKLTVIDGGANRARDIARKVLSAVNE